MGIEVIMNSLLKQEFTKQYNLRASRRKAHPPNGMLPLAWYFSQREQSDACNLDIYDRIHL